jgi:galactokinase
VTVVARGPGRVNLIGEHTDYNGGLALPFAIARGVTVTADDPAKGGAAADIVARALDLGEDDAFALDNRDRSSGWRAFVRGVVAELQGAGYALSPARLAIEGDVPRGSGLSSSAALSTALALALLARSHREPPEDLRELAKLCSRVENEWVGQNTGLMDQFAALLGTEGHALRIDFRSLEVTQIPLDLGDWTLVTVDSGASHTLAASGYNQRRAECEQACSQLGIATLREATQDDLARLDGAPKRRARHVLTENARVDAMCAALTAHDLGRAGALLDASHASLRDDYESSVPEVEATVHRLKAQGAAGARMVGGGFGGSVLALLRPGSALPDGAIPVFPGPPAGILEIG